MKGLPDRPLSLPSGPPPPAALAPRTVSKGKRRRADLGQPLGSEGSSLFGFCLGAEGLGVDLVEPLQRAEQDHDHHRQRGCGCDIPHDALGLERWTTWARVWFSETDETAWVNLAEVDFRPVAGTGSAVGDEG